jgi:predicted lipase
MLVLEKYRASYQQYSTSIHRHWSTNNISEFVNIDRARLTRRIKKLMMVTCTHSRDLYFPVKIAFRIAFSYGRDSETLSERILLHASDFLRSSALRVNLPLHGTRDGM